MHSVLQRDKRHLDSSVCGHVYPNISWRMCTSSALLILNLEQSDKYSFSQREPQKCCSTHLVWPLWWNMKFSSFSFFLLFSSVQQVIQKRWRVCVQVSEVNGVGKSDRWRLILWVCQWTCAFGNWPSAKPFTFHAVSPLYSLDASERTERALSPAPTHPCVHTVTGERQQYTTTALTYCRLSEAIPGGCELLLVIYKTCVATCVCLVTCDKIFRSPLPASI